MFEHILVPLDGSSLAECVLPHVIALATIRDASVTLLRVLEEPNVPDRGPFSSPLDAHLDNVIARAYLTEVADRLSRAGVWVETATSNGPAAAEIVAYAQQNAVDLIVMSSHGQGGLSGWNTSSVVQKVAARANRSMMIVRAYAPASSEDEIVTYRRLLVPLDGSRRAECVLPMAVSLALAHDARLVLAHIVRKPEIPDRLWVDEGELSLLEQLAACRRRRAEHYLEEVRKHLVVDAEVELEAGADVPGALQSLAEAHTFDLLMLSAHGYSGSPRRTYGSVTTSLIGYSSMPLLIVQDFEGEELVPSRAEQVTRERQGH
jgi:nucleotide-binding universal stress UspA family protein